MRRGRESRRDQRQGGSFARHRGEVFGSPKISPSFPALGPAANQNGACLDQVGKHAGSFSSLRYGLRLGQRARRLPALGEQRQARAGDRERKLGNSPSPAEVDSLAAKSERSLRSVVLPRVDRQIVVEDCCFSALSLV